MSTTQWPFAAESIHESGLEKPQNGIAGLQHWRYDLVAGLMVSLTSLPFSLGIAVASGAPPIAGLISAIVAGLIFPFLGGPYVTISGPAAGLAPALFAAMLALGHRDMNAGYPLLLGVICIVGVIQIVLSRLGAAKLSAMFPVAVVEGMLASIGLLIIAKELGHFIGHPYKAHAFFEFIAETPEELRLLDPRSFGVGIVCLVLMFVFSTSAIRKRMKFPPPLAVVIIGLILGRIVGIDANHLISIPNKLTHGIVLPNFKGLFSDPSIYYVIVSAVLTLVMIDGIESLATIKAIDKIDPFKRRSDPDRTLFAMGVSNICSSLAGGLTIIPGGVKSKLCISSGGRTLWANFYNACFLIAFIYLGSGLVNMIPYSALAAVLIHTGYKMCEPKVWRHVAHIGWEQMFLFTVTVFATLMTDLLIGIFVGMSVKLLLNMIFTSKHVWTRFGKPASLGETLRYAFTHVSQLFRNPVVGRELKQDHYHLYFDRPLVCFNSLFLNHELHRVPEEAHDVYLHLGQNVAMVDHTSCDTLMHFAEEFQRSHRGRVDLVGLDSMSTFSHAPNGMRLARARSRPLDEVLPAVDDTPSEGEPVASVMCHAHSPEDSLSEAQTVD